MWYPVTQMDQRRTLEESLRPARLSLKRSYLPDLGVGRCNTALALFSPSLDVGPNYVVMLERAVQ